MGGSVQLLPGEVLTLTYIGSGEPPATQLDISGTGAPGHVTLPYTVNYSSVPNGALWFIKSYKPGNYAPYTTIVRCIETGAGGVTWFTPGDGRVDPLPGDRIAVWCNASATPPNIVVYGVGDASNGSHGFWLGTFDNADLLKAGAAGIVKDAGADNGTVSLANDGNGNYYAAWTGGSFNATGQGDFAKSFSCTF